MEDNKIAIAIAPTFPPLVPDLNLRLTRGMLMEVGACSEYRRVFDLKFPAGYVDLTWTRVYQSRRTFDLDWACTELAEGLPWSSSSIAFDDWVEQFWAEMSPDQHKRVSRGEVQRNARALWVAHQFWLGLTRTGWTRDARRAQQQDLDGSLSRSYNHVYLAREWRPTCGDWMTADDRDPTVLQAQHDAYYIQRERLNPRLAGRMRETLLPLPADEPNPADWTWPHWTLRASESK